MFVIKLIATLFLPPLAAFLQVGITTHFWISVALTLLGWIPGTLHGLWLVFSDQQA